MSAESAWFEKDAIALVHVLAKAPEKKGQRETITDPEWRLQ